MKKVKSKEFILKRRFGSNWVNLCYFNGRCINSFCQNQFKQFFGISLKDDERKKIRITIEELPAAKKKN